ncbi:MAG: cytochrome c biogenesis protein ResB [Candidatus Eisenbacteria bacterium]|nr:cytochrome c biogenesis protein ResB [Candidatus Eisenbacteria bacterium]
MDRAHAVTLTLIVVSLALCAWVVGCTWRRFAAIPRTRGRARVARIGSLVTHASILVIVAGGLLSAATSFRYPSAAYLAAGGTLDVLAGGFTVRVDDAWTTMSETEKPVEYVSLVTVLEGGREVKRHRIEVNRPLVHRGVGVYQHEMLPSPTTIASATLEVVLPEGGGRVVRVEAPFDVETPVPGTDLSVKVVAFYSDFTYDIEAGAAALKSVRHENPAVLVHVWEAGRFAGERWVFAAFPGHSDAAALPCRLLLLGYRPDFRRGLTRFEISRQPGAPLLFVGFAAMSAGLALIYWVRVPASAARRRKEDG